MKINLLYSCLLFLVTTFAFATPFDIPQIPTSLENCKFAVETEFLTTCRTIEKVQATGEHRIHVIQACIPAKAVALANCKKGIMNVYSEIRKTPAGIMHTETLLRKNTKKYDGVFTLSVEPVLGSPALWHCTDNSKKPVGPLSFINDYVTKGACPKKLFSYIWNYTYWYVGKVSFTNRYKTFFVGYPIVFGTPGKELVRCKNMLTGDKFLTNDATCKGATIDEFLGYEL